jgi:hypothetical protein
MRRNNHYANCFDASAGQGVTQSPTKYKVTHLDAAYVYLGLSEQAVGDLDEARKAFAKLRRYHVMIRK